MPYERIFDDKERERLMYAIEQEVILEHQKKSQPLSSEPIPLSVNNEDDLDMNEIIPEEEKSTDMDDFDHYLKSINSHTKENAEVQTNQKATKNHKQGVNLQHLGLLKNKETYIDVRMFQTKESSIMTIDRVKARDLMMEGSKTMILE